MSVSEFVEKYKGQTKGYPTDNDYQGECLSIVKLYIKECFGINPPPSGSGSAYGYWSNFPNPLGEVFEKVIYQQGAIPQKGDIMIWNPTSSNKFGHIDIFVEGDGNEFTGFDQNFYGRQAHLQKHNYNNIVGRLRPKGTDMPSEGTQYVEGLGEVTFDKLIQEYGIEKERVTSARKERDEALALLENLKGEMAKLKEDSRREIDAAQDEAKQQKETLNELVGYLADSLGTTQDIPKIKAEVGNLIDVEDQLTKTRKELSEAQKDGQILRSAIATHLDEASSLSNKNYGTLMAVIGYIKELQQELGGPIKKKSIFRIIWEYIFGTK